MSVVQGSRLKFSAKFRQFGKVFSPKSVSCEVRAAGIVSHPRVRPGEIGEVWVEVIAEHAGPLIVTFSLPSGEFSTSEYEVVPPPTAAILAEENGAIESARRVVDSFRKAREELAQSLRETIDLLESEPEVNLPKPRVPESAARRTMIQRLKAAGIDTDDSWSDAKLSGAVQALDSY